MTSADNNGEHKRIIEQFLALTDAVSHQPFPFEDLFRLFRDEIKLFPSYIKGQSGSIKPEYALFRTLIYRVTNRGHRFDYNAPISELVDLVRQEIDALILGEILPSISSAPNHNLLLRQLSANWNMLDLFAMVLTYVLKPAEEYIKKMNIDSFNANGLAMKAFQEHIFANIQDSVLEAYLSAIATIREVGVSGSKGVDLDTIRACAQIYQAIGTVAIERFPSRLSQPSANPEALSYYKTHFEGPFLTRSRAHYDAESSRLLGEMNIFEYLRQLDKMHKREIAIAKQCLHPDTGKLLVHSFVDEFIFVPARMGRIQECIGIIFDSFRESTVVDTLVTPREEKDEMKVLFELLESASQTDSRGAVFIEDFAKNTRELVFALYERHSAFVRTSVAGSTGDDKTGELLTTGLLLLYRSMDVLANDVLKTGAGHPHPAIVKSIRDSFDAIMNAPVALQAASGETAYSKLLAKQFDRLFRATKVTAEQKKIDIDESTALVNFIRDKDLFLDHYKAYLSGRLLAGKSTDDEAEREVVSKFKRDIGHSSTFKLEGMLTDFKISADKFKEFSDSGCCSGLVFDRDHTVRMLTMSHWPSFRLFTVNLPPRILEAQRSFKIWYASQFSSRDINWVYFEGEAIVKFRPPSGGKYTVTMSPIQAAVFSVFHGRVGYDSYNDVKAKVEISDDILVPVLKSLLKEKLLRPREDPRTTDFPRNSYQSNGKFKSPSLRFGIKMPSLKSSEEIDKETIEQRDIIIDASIVRICKSRKVIRHTDLLAEVSHQVTLFQPNPRQVKARVESLIERNYLKRSDDDHNTYDYLA